MTMIELSKEQISRIQRKTDEILKGKRDAVIDGLESDAAQFRLAAVMSVVKNRLLNDFEIGERIRHLTNDNTRIMNCPISNIAYAALDILGIEKYKGNDETVKRMIETELDV